MGTETEGFAEALRGLKERSGLSYGSLAKRAHMSTSTLHRYCNGDAVPTEFAPVERLARLCGASRDEMVALHRRWIVADDARRRGRAAAQGAAVAQGAAAAREVAVAQEVAVEAPSPERRDGAEPRAEEPPGDAGRESVDEPVAAAAGASEDDGRRGPGDGGGAPGDDGHGAAGSGGSPGEEEGSGAADRSPGDDGHGAAGGDGSSGDPGDDPVAVLAPASSATSGPPRSRRRGRLVAAAAAVVVLTATTALAVTLNSGHPQSPGTAAGPAGRAAASGAAGPSGSPRPGPRPSTPAPSSPSASVPSGAPTPTAAGTPPSAAPSGAPAPGAAVPDRPRDRGVPLAVDVQPYVWRDPCSQVYVVDRPPAQVPPPPSEQDARGWVTALGGAPGGDMMMDLAVQSTGDETVVLHALHVRVVGKDAPLPWNAYTMGVGCGGEMTSRSFDVNLDVARPRAVSVAGRQGDREIPAVDFPYKVSANDPQMLRVTAHTAGHAVRWYLELEWSSGDRRGTLRVDDHGRPFTTSAIGGRPAFDYPLGGSGWIPHVPNEG
ncbi:helix-turn-helix domain-containing protein [Streptomyces lavendulocolor]|uniref:helix-turn-helix domain-containing protein n=1 Tax=Streptomyces lavendulocolor TaxID=67316 RepID=UPI0031CDB7B6